jgi:hypothetical protein
MLKLKKDILGEGELCKDIGVIGIDYFGGGAPLF